ncbi:DNA topoisomerase 2-binding protein 1 [Dermatophagoides farinae]|uniref:DNA topoisomerase 2-binding protein 1 n=1 Tax=Dermatophagoides farinae TaxID=6954 RepID=A0A922HYE1_DERFA|nr:DNA topoisomerase 2-binding protein 1 [Dermatophagoides farinae]
MKFLFLTFKSNQTTSPPDIMQKAFISIEKRKFKPRWVSFEMLKSTSNRVSLPYVEIIIVTDRFDDDVLNSFHDKCRIVGPLIITYCDNDICPCPQSSIPQRTLPIYSQCMRGLEVTTSDIPTTKRQFIENRVKLMSGYYHENLHINTSVLVSDSVLTRKARAAAENHIPIVSIDWIESCWIKYQHEHKQANEDSIISKYRLPIFHALNIVLSDINDREKIRNVVESNGGKFHSVLKIKPVLPNTILLLPEKRGEKYLVANRLNIPCLLPKWLHDSIQACYALPFENYMIDNLIDQDSLTTTTNVKNKRAKTVKIVPSTESAETKTESNNLESKIKEILDSNQPNDQIFAGNSIYATGFDENLLILIRNCAEKFGAFFYDSLCDSVTDVIVGPNITKSSFQKLSETKYSNHLVSIDWFIDRIQYSKNNYLIHSYSQLKDQSSSTTINKTD